MNFDIRDLPNLWNDFTVDVNMSAVMKGLNALRNEMGAEKG